MLDAGTLFERFTDRARRVVVLAQEEARLLGDDHIGTEHLLLGLIDEGHGLGARALQAIGISLDDVRREVEGIVGHGGSSPPGHIPFTPRAKKVLELSLREALQLGHNYIGTEHVLLGLIREADGVAAQVLVRLGADLSRVRQEVIRLLSGFAASGDPADPSASAPAGAREPGRASPSATYRAAALLRAHPEGPLFRRLLQAGEDMRALTLEALIACWNGDADALEEHLGDVVRLAARAGDDAQLARLGEVVTIDDAQLGIVRLRPRNPPP